jgi:hypothetical protein
MRALFERYQQLAFNAQINKEAHGDHNQLTSMDAQLNRHVHQ